MFAFIGWLPTIFQCVKGGLEQNPGLRVDFGGLARTDSEKGRIEGGHVAVDEMSAFKWKLYRNKRQAGKGDVNNHTIQERKRRIAGMTYPIQTLLVRIIDTLEVDTTLGEG